MEITFKEIVAGVMLSTFLIVLFWPSDSPSTGELFLQGNNIVPVNKEELILSGVSYNLHFSDEDGKIIFEKGEKAQVEAGKDFIRIDKVIGTIIIGTKGLKEIVVSAVDTSLSGSLSNVVLNVSSVNVNIRNFVITGPCRINLSSAGIKGELYIGEIQPGGKVEITLSSARSDLTLYIKKGFESQVVVNGGPLVTRTW
ncbi:hypothetical protein SAMN04488510_1112 [Fervidobacterium changbaicum]|uniref:Auto-transporter adhesin head GIN domain-containing protein n=1 Tax=Fervidobacterium changbaicum TaxID=310769 RepID=A0ABX5QR55_9BACT|nr:hypothetical protein [Fervidobacterium changbaicum]QAV32595.1 hypothetical protein CBS1_01750 [Fervidobacterium changbaicum]SDH33993.1 hypothetical protein SAMN04488510_1112 [Fervidobacterium changbaicum]